MGKFLYFKYSWFYLIKKPNNATELINMFAFIISTYLK